MQTIVRNAEARDVPRIESIWNQIIADTTATFTTQAKDLDGWLAQKSAAGEPVLACDRGGECVGFATYGPFRGGPGYLHIAEHTLMLGPDARGTGGGRALLNGLIDIARVQGKSALIGGISGENEAALKFHSAMGFAEVGRVPNAGRKFGRQMDLVLMHRAL
ncbi:phosphinothricin acetyltransferase [Monaibacterium marinum]|uniref:Phosphinothricin acetyltransferase n=1 Tax=Pontivivens marinum TaxID=1690039 RepID=A0A2C9CSB2_9RHOB|nr:GNAT family N-acetyltransferase [Monaibacterium marinum]SOH94090.1 phosphinothricin acetyltransferase [Monaibacterium marinum]